MFGRGDAAVQAQAARDQAGRGGLMAKGPQAKADEGLFAPDTSGQRPLFSPRPVAELTGEEIAPRTSNLDQIRAAARIFYEQVLRRTTVYSSTLHGDIRFEGARKAFHTSANPDKLRLFAALRDVLANGTLARSEPPRDLLAEPSTRAYHFLTAPVDLGGKHMEVGVTVREDANGHLYYNHNPLENAGDPGLQPAGTRRKGGPRSDGGTTYDQKISEIDDDVNLQVRPADKGGADRLGKPFLRPGPGGQRRTICA